MSWRTVLLIALLVGALVSGWSAWIHRAPADTEASAEERSGYVLRDFELVMLDAEGKESFSLKAPDLHQTPGARTLELTTPVFLMPDQHGSHWEIVSRTGWINETSDEIRLRGDVVANSPMGATQPTTVNTEELDIFPQQSLATSSVLVTQTTPGTTMQGTGMRVHLSDKRVELLSKVKLSHDPNRRR